MEKRRGGGEFNAAFQYLKGAHKKDEEKIFIKDCKDKGQRF